ncbi:MAG TPA: hypothetical protein VL832_10015, partial [Puia sp.]|nr:hypothetical protein [Puia sp.]
MRWRDRSIQVIRKLSIFYLLLIVLIICFGLYYFNYIPRNKDQLNEWGQRSLNQLASNFTKKSSDIKAIFDSASRNGSNIDSLKVKGGSYRYLNSNIPYKLEGGRPDSVQKTPPAGRPAPYIGKDKEEQWCINYSTESLNNTAILVRVKDFLQPLLEGRDDVFDAYMLFKDSDKSTPGKQLNLDILYRAEGLSASPIINADTLLKIQKNSDFSGVVEVSISGTEYELFVRPFDFYQQHVYLGGLISKENYQRNVQSTPLTFIPYSIAFFLLILVGMPFMKIYLLSPRERISARDVLSATFSFFMGSSILVLVLFYIFINIFTKMTFHHRLDKFGEKLDADIEKEFRLANQQLWQYDNQYRHLTPKEKMVLNYKQKDKQIRADVNDSFMPSSYFNVSRVFWIDSNGTTLAKWNPFNFESPLSSVRGLDFFRIFQQQAPNGSNYADSTRNYIYTGKSNTTGEFQVFVVKPLRGKILNRDSLEVNSNSITMALFLNSGTKPVVPLGFGFCLIDREGRILMDADEQRNLAENLLKETNNNEHLVHCMRYKNQDIIDNIQLYGQPCEMKVIPLNNQPLYVVVYYNKRIVTNNILRLLRFTVEVMFYIFAALALCILISGLIPVLKPNRLKFKLTKIFWVRYSTVNKSAYAFTTIYYRSLALLTIALSLVILCCNFDIRALLYISLVLPFYTVLAFIFSGMPSIPGKLRDFIRIRRNKTALFSLRIYFPFLLKTNGSILLVAIFICTCLAIINYICFTFYKSSDGLCQENICLLLIFQVLAILGLMITRWIAVLMAEYKEKKGKDKPAKAEDICRPNYIISLRFAILLIGVLPTLGVLTYGFYSEKIQYKKSKLLKIAKNSEERGQYLSGKTIPAYKPAISAQFAGALGYFDSLLFRSGAYLTESDTIIYYPDPARAVVQHSDPRRRPDSTTHRDSTTDAASSTAHADSAFHDSPSTAHADPATHGSPSTTHADPIDHRDSSTALAASVAQATAELPVSPLLHSLPDTGNTDIADEPYSVFMDNHSFHTNQDYDGYSVPSKADDNSWKFYYTTDSSLTWLNLAYKHRVAAQNGYQFLARSSIQNPMTDFFRLRPLVKFLFLLLIISFVIGFNWLIKGTLDRLFLLTFIRDHKPKEEDNLVMRYIKDPIWRPQVLAASPAPYAAFEAMINPECSTNRRDRKTARLILRNQEKFETLYDC